MPSKRVYSGAGGEDTAAIKSAYENGLKEYSGSLGRLTVGEMIMGVGGDKSTLARELAGIGEGQLPRKGTRERTRYDSEMRSINRWLAGEKGQTGRQTRSVSAPKQSKFKEIFTKHNPPSGRMSASITGWIGYDGQWRYRSIEIPPPSGGRGEIDTEAFNAAMANNDTSAAYQALFAAYAPGLTVAEASNFTIQYEQE